MQNIEIKARYPDLTKARAICRRLNAEFVGTDSQTDTYFRVPQGRLKLRESSLKGAQLIPYVRPNDAGPKKSDYLALPVADAETAKRLFTALMGVDTVVRKTREVYLIGNVRVHLDSVDGLGAFFEFEAVYDHDTEDNRRAETLKLQALLREFEIPETDLQTASYRELTR